MRRLLLTAFLLSSLGLAAQGTEPSPSSSAPSSHDPQAQQKPESPTGGRPSDAATTERPVDVCGEPTGDETEVVHEKVVSPGLLIHKVAPKYPKAARKAHIEGTVVLCAVITKDGTIANLRVLSGPDVLVQSAVKAVEQWRYKPYLLSGKAVEVYTEIRVNFKLSY